MSYYKYMDGGTRARLQGKKTNMLYTQESVINEIKEKVAAFEVAVNSAKTQNDHEDALKGLAYHQGLLEQYTNDPAEAAKEAAFMNSSK